MGWGIGWSSVVHISVEHGWYYSLLLVSCLSLRLYGGLLVINILDFSSVFLLMTFLIVLSFYSVIWFIFVNFYFFENSSLSNLSYNTVCICHYVSLVFITTNSESVCLLYVFLLSTLHVAEIWESCTVFSSFYNKHSLLSCLFLSLSLKLDLLQNFNLFSETSSLLLSTVNYHVLS